MLSAYRLYVVALGMQVLVFALWQAERMPIKVYLAGILIAAIAEFPIARWFAQGKPGVPMFELLCLSFGLQYGLIVYLQPNEVWTELRSFTPLTWESTFRAQLSAALGIGSLIASYYLSSSFRLLRRMPRFDLPIRPPRLFWYLGFAFTVGLAATLLNVRYAALTGSRIGATLYLLSSQVYIGFILMTDYIYRANKGWRWKLGLYILLALVCLVGAVTGMQENILTPLTVVFIARWLAGGRVPWRLVIAGAAIFLLLYPLKFRYRSRAWFSERESAQTITGRMVIWGQVAKEFLSEVGQGKVAVFSAQQLRISLYRFDLLHVFAMVCDKTPGQIPYYRGATYSYLIYTWMPRLFWPDKPSAQQANTILALDYEISNEEGLKVSSFGIGILAEAYANFGIVGIILLMGIQGLLFAAFSQLLNGKDSQGGRAIYIALVVPFFNGIGSSTAVLFGNILQQTVARALILRSFTISFGVKRSLPRNHE